MHCLQPACASAGWGNWYLLETIGFVVVPAFLFLQGFRGENLGVIRLAAVFTLLGIVLNRFNVSVIAFKWYAAQRYYPSWMEIVVTLAVISAELWVFRWVVTRMPVLCSVAEDRRRRIEVVDGDMGFAA
jgi:Ni/Fe-hydrogenase subunit HybB-like protein